MSAEWPQIVFGWPSALGGGALLALGVSFRRAWLAAAGALLSAGFCVYVGLNPFPFRILGPGVLLANVLAAITLRKEGRFLATVLLFPYGLLLMYFAGAVLRTW